MLLKASSSKAVNVRVKEVISLIIIFSILLAFAVLFRYIQHSFTVIYTETEFDLIIQEFSDEQIEEIDRLSFVDAVFPVKILSGEIEKEHHTVPVDIYATNNFENRHVSYFPDRLIIKKDQHLLTNIKMNPIVVDREIAKTLKVAVGDTVSAPFGENQTEVQFTIAAISEPMTQALTRPSAMILWQGEQRSAFVNSFGEEPINSYLFVKANDIEQARAYFVNEYIPMQMVEEGLLRLDDKEEIARTNASLMVEREKYLDELREELRYTPPIVILASALGFLTYLLVLHREANKKLLMNEKNFSILHALGMPKVYFMWYAILDTITVQVPVIIVSALIVKYVVYDFLLNYYLPWYLFIWFCFGAFALQIAAVFINGFLLHLKMLKSHTATQLAKE